MGVFRRASLPYHSMGSPLLPPKNQSRSHKSRRSFSRFSPGAILKGLQNPNEGQHVLQQKNGNRFNVVVSTVESHAQTGNINLVPLRGLKPNEEIYRHETVIHPDRINRLFKKSVALTSQPYTLALPSLKRAIEWGTIFSPELERIRAGIRIAMDALLRDFNKKPSYRRGDMILIEKNGRVSKGIVISNDIGNAHSPLLTIVSCSEETKTQNRFEMVVTNNLKSVRVKSHEIQTIDKAYVSRKIGSISECEMLKITTKIHWGIGIKA